MMESDIHCFTESFLSHPLPFSLGCVIVETPTKLIEMAPMRGCVHSTLHTRTSDESQYKILVSKYQDCFPAFADQKNRKNFKCLHIVISLKSCATETKRELERSFTCFLLSRCVQHPGLGQASSGSLEFQSGLPQAWHASEHFCIIYCLLGHITQQLHQEESSENLNQWPDMRCEHHQVA